MDLIGKFLESKYDWVTFLSVTPNVRYFDVQYNHMAKWRKTGVTLWRFMKVWFPEIEVNLQYVLICIGVAHVNETSYVSFNHSQFNLLFTRIGNDFEICIKKRNICTHFYRKHIKRSSAIWESVNENWDRLWKK